RRHFPISRCPCWGQRIRRAFQRRCAHPADENEDHFAVDEIPSVDCPCKLRPAGHRSSHFVAAPTRADERALDGGSKWVWSAEAPTTCLRKRRPNGCTSCSRSKPTSNWSRGQERARFAPGSGACPTFSVTSWMRGLARAKYYWSTSVRTVPNASTSYCAALTPDRTRRAS